MKPLIDPSFWSDPDIESSKAGVKLTALWLMTNSQTSLLGVCGASSARYEFETGLKSEALESTLQALPRAFIRFGTVVFVRNYIRHQFGSGDKLTKNNFFVALKSLFLSVKDDNLRKQILSDYPEFEKALPRACEGLTKPKERKVQEGEGKKGSAEGIPKSREEAHAYGTEIGMSQDDIDGWFDHFESNGWRVSGKRAALRNGKRNAPAFHRTNGEPPPPLPSTSEAHGD